MPLRSVVQRWFDRAHRLSRPNPLHGRSDRYRGEGYDATGKRRVKSAGYSTHDLDLARREALAQSRPPSKQLLGSLTETRSGIGGRRAAAEERAPAGLGRAIGVVRLGVRSMVGFPTRRSCMIDPRRQEHHRPAGRRALPDGGFAIAGSIDNCAPDGMGGAFSSGWIARYAPLCQP